MNINFETVVFLSSA